MRLKPSPALVPVAVFVALHAARPFVTGLYHDDWSLFFVKDLVPPAEYAQFFFVEFRDRPVLGIILRLVNDVWHGRTWLLTLIGSGFVAVAAMSLYVAMLRITALVQEDRSAASLATAAWIAAPWGLGYTLWPIGTTTLIALIFFSWASVLLVRWVAEGGSWRLGLAAVLLLASFLSYQAYYLAFVPIVLLAVVLRPREHELRRRAGIALLVGTGVQALAVLHALAVSTPKKGALDPRLVLGNMAYALPRALAAPFDGFYWGAPAALVLAMVATSTPGHGCAARARSGCTHRALLVCAAGALVGTLPYSIAGYLIQGTGVFSRTTLGAGVWLCLLLGVAISSTVAWPAERRRLFLSLSGALVAVLMAASAWQTSGWALSWRRQQEILRGFPFAALRALPPDAAVVLDEPTQVRNIEVFAAPWDISAAVYSRPEMRQVKATERPAIVPLYPDVTMAWDGAGLTVRPGWRIPARMLFTYRPGDDDLRRIDAPGPIIPAAR